MVQQLHRVVANANARPFDMRALRRLAIWGVSAAAALSVAVLAGYANPAAQRLLGTIAAAIGQTQRQAEVNSAPVATRPAEAENETRRLAEAVRALAADRNELLTRMSSIEQSLEDITGSINRQTAAASLPLPPSPDPVAAIPEELPPTPTWVATLPAIGGSAEADLFKPKIDLRGEFGVDVGGAVNFDTLRALWNSTKAGYAGQLEGLSPRVAVRENSKSRSAELRLIVGPLPDAEAAARLCATLSVARRSCQPAPFVGQHFALSAPEPERKSASAAERKPAPQPARQPARATP